jgi:hypothetical protein
MCEEAWKKLHLGVVSHCYAGDDDMYVDPSEGHDDFLMSIALVTEALASFVAPPQPG